MFTLSKYFILLRNLGSWLFFLPQGEENNDLDPKPFPTSNHITRSHLLKEYSGGVRYFLLVLGKLDD